MVIHKYADEIISVPGANTWADYWIMASGGINVASGVQGTKENSM